MEIMKAIIAFVQILKLIYFDFKMQKKVVIVSVMIKTDNIFIPMHFVACFS